MPPDFLYSWTESGMFLFILLVTGLVALAVHLLFLWRRLAPPTLADLSPVLQTLCGTLFVLSVTFLANTVWQTEGRAREQVNAEARNMRLIRTDMDALAGPAHDGLLKTLSEYASAVESEWPGMASSGGSPQAEQQLSGLYRAAMLGLADGEQNRLLQQRILAALDAMSQARQTRLTIARSEQVSSGQWFTVTSMALLLLVVIAVCHARSHRARGVALAIMTLAISISAFEILAHDRPFAGYLAISPNPILEAAR